MSMTFHGGVYRSMHVSDGDCGPDRPPRRSWRGPQHDVFLSRCQSAVSSLPQQTTEDFLGEALKRDLEGFHTEEAAAFPIVTDDKPISSIGRGIGLHPHLDKYKLEGMILGEGTKAPSNKSLISEYFKEFECYYRDRPAEFMFLKMLVPGSVADKLVAELTDNSVRSQLLGRASVVSEQRMGSCDHSTPAVCITKPQVLPWYQEPSCGTSIARYG